MKISFLFSAVVLTVDAKNKKEIFMKGAPDRIIGFCSSFSINGEFKELDKNHKALIIKELSSLSGKGFKQLIGFVKKNIYENDIKKIDSKDLNNFVFLGAAAIYDPPKDEVKNVIKTAHEANINVVMITGDSKNTGFSIAESVGISSGIVK